MLQIFRKVTILDQARYLPPLEKPCRIGFRNDQDTLSPVMDTLLSITSQMQSDRPIPGMTLSRFDCASPMSLESLLCLDSQLGRLFSLTPPNTRTPDLLILVFVLLPSFSSQLKASLPHPIPKFMMLFSK